MNFDKEHIDESILGKPGGGFTVPEGYFEQMQKDILRKTSENGFTVPEGYFETLEIQIQQRMKKKPETIRIQVTKFRRAMIGMAASLLLVSGFFFLKNEWRKNPVAIAFSDAKLNELSDEDIINYVDVADIKDLRIAESNAKPEDKTTRQEEEYLINNADEQLIIDEL